MHGLPSRYDENFFYWLDPKAPDCQLVAVCTIHVDDLVLAASKGWLEATYKAFVRKFEKVKRQTLPFNNIGMEYKRTDNGGIVLRQVEYASNLKLLQLGDREEDSETATASASLAKAGSESKSLTPAEITMLRGGIGSVLFLCLTRWDLLYDLVVLQTQVKDASRLQLKECNRIIYAAKRHTHRGLIFEPLTYGKSRCMRRRLSGVADSSHASATSSYAFEGNLVFLQPECDAKPQQTKDFGEALPANNVPGLSSRVHPLHVKSQKAKRLSQSTSHAETLSQLSCTAVAECVAMRYTEIILAWSKGGVDIRGTSLHKGTPTLERLMEADLQGESAVPVDSWTDCLDLLELTTRLKGVPQDRHQRLAILALREKRVAGRIRFSYWMQTEWMIATALTKHDPNCITMWDLLTKGRWDIGGNVRIRKTIQVADHEENDLRNMKLEE